MPISANASKARHDRANQTGVRLRRYR